MIYHRQEIDRPPVGGAVSEIHFDLRSALLGHATKAFVEKLNLDEQAAVEAATGEMGNKPDAVKLGWLRLRTKETWTKQRYAATIRRAFEKLRQMVTDRETGESPK